MEVDDYRKLDSLLRFYGSEITAHSNYIIAYALATAIYVYRVLDGLFLTNTGQITLTKLLWYDFVLFSIGVFFFIFGLFLVGRLLYYTELSNIAQNYMGLSHDSETNLKTYRRLLEAKLETWEGFGYRIENTLLYRMWHRLFNKVDDIHYDKHYDEIIRFHNPSKWRILLLLFSNALLKQRYRDLLRKVLS